MMIVHYVLLALTAVVVFALASRFTRAQNSLLGGFVAVLLFIAHPMVTSGAISISAWDGFYAAFFFLAWNTMEEWSLFMRSWILAGLYAFGLWVGSSFAFWIPAAMIPWVAMNRRPVNGLIQLATVVIGGFLFFGAVWSVTYFFAATTIHPTWMQWVRWSSAHLPVGFSLPFALLMFDGVATPVYIAVKSRRADAAFCLAVLIILIFFLGSREVGSAIVSLGAPLIAYALVRRDFLFNRMVRWIGAFTFLATLAIMVWRHEVPQIGWMIGILWLGYAIHALRRSVPTSGRASWEAACLGAYLAESIGIFLLR